VAHSGLICVIRFLSKGLWEKGSDAKIVEHDDIHY